MDDKPTLLKAARRRSGLTQEAISKELGIKRSTYASYELGLVNVPEPLFAKVQIIGRVDEVGRPTFPVPQIMVPIPYIGTVSAGDLVDWTDPVASEDWLEVPPEMAGKGRFSCTVGSDSCYPLLWPGDRVVWQQAELPKIGAVVIHMSTDNRVTIKMLNHDGSNYILHPLNPAYEDCIADGRMLGYLVGIIRVEFTRKMTIYDPAGIKP